MCDTLPDRRCAELQGELSGKHENTANAPLGTQRDILSNPLLPPSANTNNRFVYQLPLLLLPFSMGTSSQLSHSAIDASYNERFLHPNSHSTNNTVAAVIPLPQ